MAPHSVVPPELNVVGTPLAKNEPDRYSVTGQKLPSQPNAVSLKKPWLNGSFGVGKLVP